MDAFEQLNIRLEQIHISLGEVARTNQAQGERLASLEAKVISSMDQCKQANVERITRLEGRVENLTKWLQVAIGALTAGGGGIAWLKGWFGA